MRGGAPVGARGISLNVAVSRSVFEGGARVDAGPVLRPWRPLLLFFSKWWQPEALYRSNAEYRPHWCPASSATAGPLLAVSAVPPPSPNRSSPYSRAVRLGTSLSRLRRKGHPRNGSRPATTQGLPSPAALGPEGGDGAGAAGPGAGLPQQVRIRHRAFDRLRADALDRCPVGIRPAPRPGRRPRRRPPTRPHPRGDRPGTASTASPPPPPPTPTSAGVTESPPRRTPLPRPPRGRGPHALPRPGLRPAARG
ncbi:phosphatidylglycerol lysyltransferase domain-containing protein [Streptomyces sp. NPDC001920]